MTSFVARLLVAAACLLGLAGPSAWAQPPAPILLTATTPAFTVGGDIQSWLESGTDASIEQVSQRPQVFRTVPALHREALSTGATLWLRLLVARNADAPTRWSLNIPLPFVDRAEMFQRDAQGRWQRQLAGDTLAQSQWSQRGPYPDFTLDLPDTAAQEIYLRIHDFKHLSVPVRIASGDARAFQRMAEFVALGLLLGVLSLLVVLSVVRYFEHGNRSDLGAAAFSLLVLATVAHINGILNMLVWTEQAMFADYAYSVLPVLAVGSSLLFVRMLYAISTHFSRYDRFLRGVGVATIVSTLTYAMDRGAADRIGTVVVMVATTTGLIATFLSWRGNSRIWPWLMAAYVPQYLCLIRMMFEALGWLPTWWEMRYILSASVAFSVPILVYALARVTHDRKELEVRARHLPTQDALTGLLTRDAFLAELTKAHNRVIEAREPMAVVVVKVVNYRHIRKGLGDPMAENCLLRAVVKLHRILRDMDPAGRIAANEFGLILEGVVTRQVLTERLVQLIGSGLIPLAGLHPPVTLQFHAACVLLHEHPVAPLEVLQSLESILEGMSSHTRRPIRHLEPPQTIPVPLAHTSSLP